MLEKILPFVAWGLTTLSHANWVALKDCVDYQQIDKHYAELDRDVRLHVLRFQQGKFRVFVHSFHDQPDHQRLALEQFRQDNQLVAVLSGGFFYPDYHKPVGLVVQQGKTHFPLSKRFSGVLWIKDNRLHITPTDKYKKQTIQPDYAIQGYPRLVDPKNHLGIKRQKSKFRFRAAVCTRADTFMFIINDKQKAGMSLYELATILQVAPEKGGLGCDIALNLDGGPAPGISLDPSLMSLEIREWWQVPNALGVAKKP
jgi:uncharacterized protein YigE (DUF2233 family)